MSVASLIAALPPLIDQYMEWWIGGVIIVLGLLVYGFRDLVIFSASRVWAISSVCFAESIRKRVLWITPLAILGVILISQFQRPTDEADAVRQMLKVCLFATGVVVTITAVILACTNLPKEIENRVIFTVVTKPTTRLEIVAGKVLGFARVSAAILLIMGLFTFGYVYFTSFGLQRAIAGRLETTEATAAVRPTLEYYRDNGLLTARGLTAAANMRITARDAQPGESGTWILGGEGDVLVPFDLTPDELIPPGDPTNTPLGAGVAVLAKVGFDGRIVMPADDAPNNLPAGVAAPATDKSNPAPVTEARLSVSILDRFEETMVPPAVFDKGQGILLTDQSGNQPFSLFVDPQAAPNVARWQRVYVSIMGVNQGVEYYIAPESVKLLIPPVAQGQPPRVIEPSVGIEGWYFRGRPGRVGYQVRGGNPAKDPTHVVTFKFRDAAPADSTGTVPFEFRCDIERSGTEDSDEASTRMQVVVRNEKSGKTSEPIVAAVETNRPIFFKVPAEFLAGGDYDVLIRCVTSGHYLGVSRGSLLVVQRNQSFVFNLAKSLFIMWLMAILVISVAIFASTFLSWPIAIVLTLVMLLGRWGVTQLGDALQPGIGNQVATDLGFARPEVTVTASKVVDALARFLTLSAKVLPDISQFASIEDLERGVAVPPVKVQDALLVLLTFALPLSVLSYVILRNKEVAP